MNGKKINDFRTFLAFSFNNIYYSTAYKFDEMYNEKDFYIAVAV